MGINTGHSPKALKLTLRDVEFLVEDVWKAKSAKGGNRVHLVLTRWDVRKAPQLDNLVLLSKEEARVHEALPDPSSYSQEFRDYVLERLHYARSHVNKVDQ